MPKGVYPHKRKPEVGYNVRHLRVAEARGKAREHTCKCGRQAREWAQIHGTTGQDVNDYIAMCNSCHQRYDMTPEKLEKIRAMNIGRKRPDTAERNRQRKSAES